MQLTDHLFRRESARMVAALTRIFGVHHLALAEDVVQDAFCRALEVWKFRGVPENPSAWLMATAKHRAIDILRRERRAAEFAPEVWHQSTAEGRSWDALPDIHPVEDDELRLMFTCCHPRLPEVAQVTLVLRISCGFGINEIAGAFLCTEAATEKRITRARKVLAATKTLFDLRDDDLAQRLSSVHRALYLLFNEGYHGSCSESAVRIDLCREAMRLTALLVANPLTATPATQALSALMSLHAARLPGRVDGAGNLSSLWNQDRSTWDPALLAAGQRMLDLSARGTVLSEYHLEAGIASLHARARIAGETDWQSIVMLYDRLLVLRPSPVVALNRAIAVAQHEGAQRGLEELAAINDIDRLAAYPFYAAALGELELRNNRHQLAREHFSKARKIARNLSEKQFFEQRIAACESLAHPWQFVNTVSR